MDGQGDIYKPNYINEGTFDVHGKYSMGCKHAEGSKDKHNNVDIQAEITHIVKSVIVFCCLLFLLFRSPTR